MKNLILLLLFLLSSPCAFEGMGQHSIDYQKEVIVQLDQLMDSLELYPRATYLKTHKLFLESLQKKDSSTAAIVMSQLSGFYNSLQNTSRMLETADSSALILPKKPSFDARFRVALARSRAAARRRHTEDSRRWVDTLTALMVGVDDVRKKHAFLLSDAITSVREQKKAEALDLVREADALISAEDDPRRQEAVHTLAAIVYITMGKIKESDEQVMLARELMDPITRPISRADRLEFLAFNRVSAGEYDRALILLDSAEMMLHGYDAPHNIIKFMLTRGEIIGQQGDWATANAIFKDALLQMEDIEINPSNTLYWIGISYRGLDKYDTAIEYFKRAVNESLARKSMADAGYFAEIVSESYEWKNKHEPALEWYKKHINYRDSAITADFALKEELATSKYETFRAKQESKQVLAKAQLVKRKNQLLASIVIGLFLIGLIGIYAFRQRQQSVKLKVIEADRKEAEMKLKNLTLNQQLNVQALTLTQKNALLKSLETDLSDMRSGNNVANAQAISKLSRSIRNDRTESKDWEVFMASLKEMHGELFKALQQQHPDLTSNDHRLLAMIKLNMTTKEMALALSVSDAGAKKARYRIRKKLNLDTSVSLSSYLNKLEENQNA